MTTNKPQSNDASHSPVEPVPGQADDLRQPERTIFGSEFKEGEIGIHVGSGILANDYGIIRLPCHSGPQSLGHQQ